MVTWPWLPFSLLEWLWLVVPASVLPIFPEPVRLVQDLWRNVLVLGLIVRYAQLPPQDNTPVVCLMHLVYRFWTPVDR